MKAAIYHGIKHVSIEEREKPTAGDKDVVIQVVKAGICGTDVHAYLAGGDDVGIHAENEFGHEFVGIICEVGKNVADLHLGDRVTICPTARRPESCGLNSTEIADMSGAFSEYVYVENAKKDENVFLLPENLSFDRSVLTEPLSVSTHAVEIADLKGGEKALVYGAGTIGLCALAALQAKGIKDIIISDINEARLNIAKEMGATPFHSGKGNLMEFVKEKWGVYRGNSGEDCINADVVIDCAGLPMIIDEFIGNAKTLSKLIIVAVHGKNVEISPYWVLAKEVTLKGSRGYTAKDILTSIHTLAQEECKLEKIITQKYCHMDIGEAFEQACDGKNAIKVVIEYCEQ